MSEIRKDPVTGEQVIYSPGRENRPNFTGMKKTIELHPSNCPFCRGNEDMTPPEICRIEENGNWQVRVVPNRFPVLEVEEGRQEGGEGLFRKFKDAGAHEVIIETPDHHVELPGKDYRYFRNVFSVYRDRILDLRKDFRMKYIQIFKNYGAPAGATISHHHSQLIALPFVPEEIRRKFDLLADYRGRNGRSLIREIVAAEMKSGARVVCGNGHFAAIAPWCSRSPFQVSLFPLHESDRFEDVAEEDLDRFSEVFFRVVRKLVRALGDLPLNLVLNNAPCEKIPSGIFRWSLDVFPMLEGSGGFEMGTGTRINPVLPEKAASVLNQF